MKNCSAVLLRYRHNQISGERLNFGVAAVDQDAGQILLRLDPPLRLAATFPGFDSASHQAVCKSLQDAIAGHLDFGPEATTSASELMSKLWPDRGTSYVFSTEIAGTSASLEEFADYCFDSYVRQSANSAA